MKKMQRFAAVGLAAALSVGLAACGDDDEDEATSPATSTSSSAMAPTAAGDGVTEVSDIFGPGCSAVPTEGEGSANGMVDDPVGTAASNNPLLKTLVQAVTAADLVDTLNTPSAAYTVFAPADSAFAKVPAADLKALLADKAALTKVLTYHVIPQRYDAAGLVEAKSVKSVEGQNVTIGGTASAPTINGNPVVCGNIPTANATVFVIGSVLMPPAA